MYWKFQEIVDEIDEDGSGELEFPEFIQLAAKFLIEEDEEQMKWELREAFRIYDKQGFIFYILSLEKQFLKIQILPFRKRIYYSGSIEGNFTWNWRIAQRR